MVTATGLGSGLDINTLVTAIVDAERTPLIARVDAKKANIDNLVSGYGSLQTAMAAVRDSVAKLADATQLNATSATSSQASAVSLTADSTAQIGTYSVSVSQLAQPQSLISGNFSAATDVVGSGTLTIGVGTPSYNASPNETTYASFNQRTSVSITIAANSTLADVRDAINAANAGVNASILQDGSNYKLMINGDSAGLGNALSLTVSGDSSGTDTDSSGLSQLAFDASTANLTQTVAPQDAMLSLNGLSVTSSSNTVTNVVDGVSLTLLSTTSSNATVSISRDTAAITGLVDTFVSAYNTYVGSQKSLTKYDATTGDAGFLQGDAMTRTMISQIRALIADEITGLTGNISVLSDLGISVETDGSLKTNAITLDTAVRTNFDSVQKFFVGETVSGAAVSGFAGQIDTLLDSFLDSDGLILTKLSSLDDKLKAVEEDRLLYNQRMEALEARYLRQFNAMDALVGQLTSTGDMLKSQLDALPGYQNLRQSGNR